MVGDEVQFSLGKLNVINYLNRKSPPFQLKIHTKKLLAPSHLVLLPTFHSVSTVILKHCHYGLKPGPRIVRKHMYMYVFMYNADPPCSDHIMRPRIFIGDWNGHSLDDISLLICCYYLFALLDHVVAVVIGKILFVGS